MQLLYIHLPVDFRDQRDRSKKTVCSTFQQASARVNSSTHVKTRLEQTRATYYQERRLFF
jgi:hypothetical protein